MPRRRVISITLGWVLLAATGLRGDTVETIDARLLTGDLVSIDAKRLTMTVKGKTQSLELKDVLIVDVTASRDPDRRPGQLLIETAGGGRIAATGAVVTDGKLTVSGSAIGTVALPLSRTTAIYMPDGSSTVAALRRRCRELRLDPRQRDIMLAVRGDEGKHISVQGVLKGIGASRVVFTWKQKERITDRGKVRAILLAGADVDDKSPAGFITATDGSRLPFTTMTFAKGKMVCQTPDVGEIRISRSAVANVRFISPRVTALSELKPSKVTQRGFLDRVFTYRIGRSLSGGAIRMDGQTYADGVAVHSHAELTYRLDGAYSRLVALAGIDDAVRPNGDATIVLLGDGKRLAEPIRLVGKGPAVRISVSLEGIKELTIRIEFGQDKLDVSDHVDIVDARLIK